MNKANLLSWIAFTILYVVILLYETVVTSKGSFWNNWLTFFFLSEYVDSKRIASPSSYINPTVNRASIRSEFPFKHDTVKKNFIDIFTVSIIADSTLLSIMKWAHANDDMTVLSLMEVR